MVCQERILWRNRLCGFSKQKIKQPFVNHLFDSVSGMPFCLRLAAAHKAIVNECPRGCRFGIHEIPNRWMKNHQSRGALRLGIWLGGECLSSCFLDIYKCRCCFPSLIVLLAAERCMRYTQQLDLDHSLHHADF